jgi:translation initiation factor 2A
MSTRTSERGMQQLENRSEDGIRRQWMTGQWNVHSRSELTKSRIPVITPNETHLLRATSSDILISAPPLAPRPSIRLKLDGNIRGLFLSNPIALPPNMTASKPVNPHPEPAVAVWVGERKGAPANLGLFTLSILLGKKELEAGADIVVRDMPLTTARKAFYKADKLNVKWNKAGTMVGLPCRRYGPAE